MASVTTAELVMCAHMSKAAAAATRTLQWYQWLKMSFNVALPNGDSWSGGVVLPKHHDMLPIVDVNGNVDLKQQRDSSEPVES